MTVSAAVSLANVTAADFTPTHRTVFTGAIAASLGVPSANVGITSLARRRRSVLNTGGLVVAFAVQYTSSSAAAGGISGISSLGSSGSFASALMAGGIPTTGVVVTVTPSMSIGGGAGAPPLSNSDAISGISQLFDQRAGSNMTAAQVVGGVSGAASLLNNIAAQAGNSSTGGAGLTAELTQQLTVQRENLLSVLSSSLTASNVSALTTAAITESASAVAQLTAVPGQLSPTARTAAVAALSTLASASGNITAETANVMVKSLDAIVTAATGGSAASASAGEHQATLMRVVDVMNDVAMGQVAQLNSTTAPPIQISTPTIQVSVQLDDPGKPSADGSPPRIYSQSFTAPGSASSFDPLPAGTLDGADGPVVSQFMSLAFDPHGNPNEALASGRTGVTRLAFSYPESAGGGEVSVQNLSTPITFTLPRVDLSGGKQAVCTFWDERSASYRSRGCAGQPNPLPPSLSADWAADLVLSSDADIARVRCALSVPDPPTLTRRGTCTRLCIITDYRASGSAALFRASVP